MNRKQKSIQPFRIKLSSIVSIRGKHYEYQQYQKQPKSKQKTYWQWLDPIPNQDDTITLIGRRIKCILPKSKVKESSTNRVIEGEVVSILQRQASHLTVSLLVHKDVLPTINLQTDTDPGTTSSNNNTNSDTHPIIHVPQHEEQNINISQTERQKRIYEERIRGKDTSILQLSLPIHQSKHDIRWVIRKATYLPVSKSHSSVSVSGSNGGGGGRGGLSLSYVGDENDEETQQEKNSRWVSNLHPLTQMWHRKHMRVGEVVDVIPTNTITNTNAASASASTGKDKLGSLAKVVIRPLKFVEDTVTGRMEHHLWNEVCDVDFEANVNVVNVADETTVEDINNPNPILPKSIGTASSASAPSRTIEVPIEDLVVIGKKANRLQNPNEKAKDVKVQVSENEIAVRYKYNERLQVFEPLNQNQPCVGVEGKGKGGQKRACHRCRNLNPENRMGQCQSEYCSSASTSDVQGSDIGNGNGHNKWWCKQCIRLLRKRRVFVLRKDEPFYGPCCLGQCDCKDCVKNSMILQGESFQKTMVDCCKRVGTLGSPSSSIVDPSSSHGHGKDMNCMHCMRKCCKYGIKCSTCSRLVHGDCLKWETDLWNMKDGGKTNKCAMEEDSANPTCYQCKSLESRTLNIDASSGGGGGNIFELTVNALDLMPPMEFSLPFNLLDNLPKPKFKPHVHTARPSKRQRTNTPKKNPVDKARKTSKKETTTSVNGQTETTTCTSLPPETEEFIPTSSRIVPYDASTKSMRSVNNSAAHAAKSLASMRSGGRKTVPRNTRRTEEKKSSGRAARANQRRMLKDTWMAGGVKEALSGCEHALRFGKSIIHGWGVFTDEEISAGDLIVEYR
jgi:hypothetical protein